MQIPISYYLKRLVSVLVVCTVVVALGLLVREYDNGFGSPIGGAVAVTMQNQSMRTQCLECHPDSATGDSFAQRGLDVPWVSGQPDSSAAPLKAGLMH